MDPKLSVVIPARNEAGNLAVLFDEIRRALDGRVVFEIICVDDGSNDDTPRELKSLLSAADDLRVLRHDVSCGQSTAVLSGVRAARGSLVATLDGDGQNDPANLPDLLDAWEGLRDEGRPLLIIGHRTARHDTWLRRLSSRIANGVRGWLLGDRTPDSGCGLKLFRRSDYLNLPYFDHMHRFTPALILRDGGRAVSVPVGHRPRREGKSKYGLHNRLWVGIVDLFGVRWLIRRSRRPGAIEEIRKETQ